jgi:hypothetical protein
MVPLNYIAVKPVSTIITKMYSCRLVWCFQASMFKISENQRHLAGWWLLHNLPTCISGWNGWHNTSYVHWPEECENEFTDHSIMVKLYVRQVLGMGQNTLFLSAFLILSESFLTTKLLNLPLSSQSSSSISSHSFQLCETFPNPLFTYSSWSSSWPFPFLVLSTKSSFGIYEVYWKVPELLLLQLPQWKKMWGEAKVTHPQAYCIGLPRDTALWTRIVFTWVHFDFMFRFVCNGWQNRVTCLH